MLTDLRCQDCGQRHETSADALACDHALGHHATPVRGCLSCLDELAHRCAMEDSTD